MESQNQAQHTGQTIRNLYPTLTGDQLKEAEANLRRYFEIAIDVLKDQGGIRVGVDTTGRPATMEERSNANLKS
jgi:hypothetical protein